MKFLRVISIIWRVKKKFPAKIGQQLEIPLKNFLNQNQPNFGKPNFRRNTVFRL